MRQLCVAQNKSTKNDCTASVAGSRKFRNGTRNKNGRTDKYKRQDEEFGAPIRKKAIIQEIHYYHGHFLLRFIASSSLLSFCTAEEVLS